MTRRKCARSTSPCVARVVFSPANNEYGQTLVPEPDDPPLAERDTAGDRLPQEVRLQTMAYLAGSVEALDGTAGRSLRAGYDWARQSQMFLVPSPEAAKRIAKEAGAFLVDGNAFHLASLVPDVGTLGRLITNADTTPGPATDDSTFHAGACLWAIETQFVTKLRWLERLQHVSRLRRQEDMPIIGRWLGYLRWRRARRSL